MAQVTPGWGGGALVVLLLKNGQCVGDFETDVEELRGGGTLQGETSLSSVTMGMLSPHNRRLLRRPTVPTVSSGNGQKL